MFAAHKMTKDQYRDAQVSPTQKFEFQYKMGKNTSSHFYHEKISVACKYMKRCSNPLIVRKMQIKVT